MGEFWFCAVFIGVLALYGYSCHLLGQERKKKQEEYEKALREQIREEVIKELGNKEEKDEKNDEEKD